MIRKTLTILSLIGLLISVGLGAVSMFTAITYTYSTLDKRYPSPRMWYKLKVTYACDRGRISRNADGYNEAGLGMGSYSVLCELWMPALIFAAYPVYRLLPFHRRRKRKKLGLCLKCGYNLRGSKDRCSECGTGFSN